MGLLWLDIRTWLQISPHNNNYSGVVVESALGAAWNAMESTSAMIDQTRQTAASKYANKTNFNASTRKFAFLKSGGTFVQFERPKEQCLIDILYSTGVMEKLTVRMVQTKWNAPTRQFVPWMGTDARTVSASIRTGGATVKTTAGMHLMNWTVLIICVLPIGYVAIIRVYL